MEIFINVVSLGIVACLTYVFLKKGKESAERDVLLNNSVDEIIKAEKERVNRIQNKVNVFLDGASFYETIGVWKEKKIYKYVFKNGFLYEFLDTMSDGNYRVGIDDDFLCFEQLSYKRIHNPSSEVLNKLLK